MWLKAKPEDVQSNKQDTEDEQERKTKGLVGTY